MAISDELTRIQGAKADIKTAIEAKGVTVPSDALIDTYDTYIGQISGGGGGQAEEDLKNLIERDITSITIPSGTTTIGNSVFYECRGLTSITIPNGVTSIGSNAFNGCSSLTSLTVERTTPPGLVQNALANTDANLVIYVPAESVETYKTTGNWVTYADRIQAIPSE